MFGYIKMLTTLLKILEDYKIIISFFIQGIDKNRKMRYNTVMYRKMRYLAL